MPEQIKLPTTHTEAITYAGAALLRATENSVVKELLPTPEITPTDEFYQYAFKLQAEREKQGAMDYNLYAQDMWNKCAELSSEDEGYELFRQGLITGLHSIDMSELVQPGVETAMPKLIEEYHDKIKSISLWSTGDVAATGYQVAKISGSQVTRNFMRNLVAVMPADESQEFLDKKTHYMVEDNKFDRLKQHVDDLLEANPDEPIKLVIIEDSTGNFKKVEDSLAGEIETGKVVVVPIWFMGSRAGLEAERAVESLIGNPSYEAARTELDNKKNMLNAIFSFEELLDTDRFGGILSDAHVLVDFDGVIGDNIGMRDRQAAVAYGALLAGLKLSTGKSLSELEALISDRVAKP